MPMSVVAAMLARPAKTRWFAPAGPRPSIVCPSAIPSRSAAPMASRAALTPRGLGQGCVCPMAEAPREKPASPTSLAIQRSIPLSFAKRVSFCNDKKVCETTKEVESYQACKAGRKCKSNAVCVVLTQTAANGYCLPTCDLQQPACDGGKGTCQKLPSGKGACLPNGTGGEDAKCGPSGDTLKPEAFCAKGLICTGLSANGAICLKTVAQCSETACVQGRVCLTGQSGGVCGKSCTAGGTDCPNALKCIQVQVSGSAVNVCGP